MPPLPDYLVARARRFPQCKAFIAGITNFTSVLSLRKQGRYESAQCGRFSAA